MHVPEFCTGSGSEGNRGGGLHEKINFRALNKYLDANSHIVCSMQQSFRPIGSIGISNSLPD